MPDIHWSLLGLHVPNVLPKSTFGSHWVRPAGRLIWSSLLFTIGIVIAYAWTTKPKRSTEPATWAQTILGAMGVWFMMALGYGTIPHEWLTFGNSYLNFNTATFVMHKNRLIHFDITRSAVIDIGVTVIYGIAVVLQVWLFVRWQKRPVLEAGAEDASETTEPPSIGPFSRLRRRDKRVSAYGRPVTTNET